MAQKQEVLNLNKRIKKHTDIHYKNNKTQASLHNWWGRCMAKVIKGRSVWPPISHKELEAFFISSKFPRRYWGVKKC